MEKKLNRKSIIKKAALLCGSVLLYFAVVLIVTGYRLKYNSTEAGMVLNLFGKYYVPITAAIVFIVILYFIISCNLLKHGKSTRLMKLVTDFTKNKFLIGQFVSRDFKTKYKRSSLGVLWSLMNPLLYMAIQYVVFSNLFHSSVPHFPLYLLCGNIAYNFFVDGTTLSLTSITGNAALITKVYVPPMIYPVTRTMSSLINLLISIIPLVIVSFIAGVYPTKAYLLLPFVIVCLWVYVIGIGLILAAAMVHFRDMLFLWGIFTTLMSYLTPIFYPASIIPEKMSWILKVNPLYYYISFIRSCIIDGVSPELSSYLLCIGFAVASFIIGKFIFNKSKNNFILYL